LPAKCQTFQDANALKTFSKIKLAKSFSDDYIKQDRLNGNQTIFDAKNSSKRRSLYSKLSRENMLLNDDNFDDGDIDDLKNLTFFGFSSPENNDVIISLDGDFFLNTNNQSCINSPSLQSDMEMSDFGNQSC